MRKSTFEQIFFSVSHPSCDDSWFEQEEGEPDYWRWMEDFRLSGQWDLLEGIMFIKRYVLLPLEEGTCCTWLLSSVKRQMRWRNQKISLQESILCFCATRMIVCLNSVQRASRVTLQKLFPILPRGTHTSSVRDVSSAAVTNQLKRQMCCLVSDLYLKDGLTHSSGRIRLNAEN